MKKNGGLDSGYLSSDTGPATSYLTLTKPQFPHWHTKGAELGHHSNTQVALYQAPGKQE